MTRDDSWNYAEILWNGIQAKAVTAALEQLSYKEQWYLEKRNAICMTCGRVSPLSTQSTFEDLAVDFEGTTASGAERFYRRTFAHLQLKNGLDIYSLSRLMGHEHIKITQRYLDGIKDEEILLAAQQTGVLSHLR